ncbi:hypothetical protein [Parabacteroides sp. PF5-9]|uniref:hypothetical protein n=1 Tax=Parabacteroides sp. PF5-9 TaxID=1742404 RepID=UPI0024733A79|nr:hypothetical protein [Parabacteroides sp. PF5-9]MDH6358084.1 hypothetical protein [Parabacteroides sp. PF5-9]
MKRFILSALLAIISFTAVLNGQTTATSDPLATAVERLDQAQTPDDWKQTRILFERLASVNPEALLPTYYLAFIDIQLSFIVTDQKEKYQYLEEAETYLEKLKKTKLSDKAIRSEISTLKGYWYFAQMALNPAVNGPKYAGVITAAYSEALQQNPDNPRAIVLNAHFQQNMSNFTGGSYASFESDMKQAKTLFETIPVDPLLPHWGKEWIKSIR